MKVLLSRLVPDLAKVKNYTTLFGFRPLSHVVQHDLNAHSLTQRHYCAQVLLT